MTAEREMTLSEWCARLPEWHAVNRELRELRANLAALADRLNAAPPAESQPQGVEAWGSREAPKAGVTMFGDRCQCMCHRDGNAVHVAACCQPETPAVQIAAPGDVEAHYAAKVAEQRDMAVLDKYAELARALGFETVGWFDDPIAPHEEIVARAAALWSQGQAVAVELVEAAKAIKFDIYHLTTPDMRAAFDGREAIAVVQQETIKRFVAALAQQE